MSTLTRRPSLGTRLLNSLTYPHGLTGYRAAYRPGATSSATRAEVVSVTPRSSRAASILLKPHTPVQFQAGQHLLLTAEVDGVVMTRCYSFSDAARADGLIEVTVAHIPDGRVSGHLVTQVRPGDIVGVSGAMGEDFALSAERPPRVVLVAGGSGITPLRAIWRTLVAEGRGETLTLLAYARTQDDALFADEVRELGGVVRLTREGGERFSAGHLNGVDLRAAEVFTCGPTGLVEAVREAVTALNPGTRIHTESFAPAIAPADPEAVEGLVTFAGSGVTAHADGTTLLEQAEAAGLAPKSGCRMGICHSCDITKRAGVVTDVRTGQPDDGTERVIQPCITRACGDVQLDL